MAKATYAPMFETVSGALTKINKKSPHAADQKMILATHRKAATTNPDCLRVYIRGIESITRSTALSADEVAARLRFSTVAAAVKDRKEDLTHVNADKQAFLAQKDEPNGCKTMRKYLWKICGEAYDQAHPNG
jgi:hypothetical protein